MIDSVILLRSKKSNCKEEMRVRFECLQVDLQDISLLRLGSLSHTLSTVSMSALGDFSQ